MEPNFLKITGKRVAISVIILIFVAVSEIVLAVHPALLNLRYLTAPVDVQKLESTGVTLGIKTQQGCDGFRVNNHYGDWSTDTFAYSYLCVRLRATGWMVPYIVLGRANSGEAVKITEYWVQWHAPRFVLFVIQKGN
jgi:hypothetical protein